MIFRWPAPVQNAEFEPFRPPVRTMPDYASPPPPHVYGNGVGEFNNHSQPFGANRPPVREFNRPAFSPVMEANLQKAEKEIRNAWICGIIVCAFTTIFALLGMSASVSPSHLPGEPIAMLFGVFIYGGLTLGVFFKNRVCAILLFGLFLLDKILMMASGNIKGIILTLVFIYYFAVGIVGTFAYHKLKKQMA